MSNRPIILIGAGGIVESAHLPAYQKAGLKVIGITDLDQQKARNIAKKSTSQTYMTQYTKQQYTHQNIQYLTLLSLLLDSSTYYQHFETGQRF